MSFLLRLHSWPSPFLRPVFAFRHNFIVSSAFPSLSLTIFVDQSINHELLSYQRVSHSVHCVATCSSLSLYCDVLPWETLDTMQVCLWRSTCSRASRLCMA